MGRQLAREHPVEADLVIPVPGVRHPGGRRLRRGVRHPVRPGSDQERLRRPHVHPAVADASASSASGSSSTRCERSSAASAWWWWTTRSSAATPSARSSGCCARPAPPRCTYGSPPRRCKWPCFYGIDFASRAELIANGADDRGDPPGHRRRLPGLHLAERHDRRHRAAARAPVHRLLHRPVPDRTSGADKLGKYLLERRGGLPLRPAPRSGRHPPSIAGGADADPGTP